MYKSKYQNSFPSLKIFIYHHHHYYIMTRGKENQSIGGIEGLTSSEKRIIEALSIWNHQEFKSNPFNIANYLKLSESTINQSLRRLNLRGFVISSCGIWHLNPTIKQEILNLERKDLLSDDRPAPI